MYSLANLDLLSVGLSTAAIGILAFAVFFNNRKSITNQAFLFFSVITVLWGWVNYSSYQIHDPAMTIWLNRLTIFFGTWHAFGIFQFFYIYPNESYRFGRIYKFLLLPWAFVTSLITLTPLALVEVTRYMADGRAEKIANGPGMALFGLSVFGFVIGAVVVLIKKIWRTRGQQRLQLFLILIGTILTFALLLPFNFILPAVFGMPRFIPLGMVWILPFIFFSAYAIIKHGLLNTKVIGTEILTFALLAVSFIEVVITRDIIGLVFRITVFILIFFFSILLIRSVRREVAQREQLQKLTGELQAANTKLKELDELKTEFMSIASHQLRTPLSVIKGYTSLMEEGAYGDVSKEEKKILHNIDISNERLIKLVDEFLNISRIEQGRIKYSFAEMDAVPMAEGVIAELKEKAAPQHVKLSLRAEEKFFKVAADEEKLRHCLYNFVDNAIKYSPDNEEVIIYLEKKNSGIAARVCDKGVGLDKDDIKNLFQKFYRSPHVLRDYQGTGLGLFVVKQFIEAHGGRVWAKSKGIGKGSEFGFWIPLRGKSERVTSERVKSEGEGV